MSSKYTEMLDSLKSDEGTKRIRAERVLSAQSGETAAEAGQAGAVSAVKARKPILAGRRGIAVLTAAVFFIAAVSIPVGIILNNNRGLLHAISLLTDSYVDMDGVAAFGVWNAPDSASASARITDVSYVNAVSETFGRGGKNLGLTEEDWSDDERYDWESDFDWDPTKSNVLIAIGDDGKIEEVVYERTNNRGQVRQDTLGNAAAVYVSNGFTYVMYVNDEEWKFGNEINFAQEMRTPSGFACHHEKMQTVVIHNATGKVFALKDIIPQVNELSGATNYTLQAEPFKDDILYVRPMYGNLIPQWYNVVFDEQKQTLRYELVLPWDYAVTTYSLGYHARAVRRDRYGQQYVLEGNDWFGEAPRAAAGAVNLPVLTRHGNAVTFSAANGMMFGTDGRMYAFDGGKLKVFKENFELQPVEEGTEVLFEGVADDFAGRYSLVGDGVAYSLKNGYLYSMFGEVWKVDADGAMRAEGRLEGSFPRFADDGYLIGGEIIAFVDTELTEDGRGSVNGRMVRIRFGCEDGTCAAEITHIIQASEISKKSNYRLVIEQNERPLSLKRGETKYFFITVQDGTPYVEYFAYGRDGGVLGLTKPVTEPLSMN